MTQSGNLTFTTNTARYLQLGKLVVVVGNVTITGTGSSGSKIALALPAALTARTLSVANPPQVVGQFHYFDASGLHITGSAILDTISELVFMQNGSVSSYIGVSPAFQAANTDTLEFTAQWELA
jgi:hypothetical protein